MTSPTSRCRSDSRLSPSGSSAERCGPVLSGARAGQPTRKSPGHSQHGSFTCCCCALAGWQAGADARRRILRSSASLRFWPRGAPIAACTLSYSGSTCFWMSLGMNFSLVGLSHKTAPIEVRERLAFPEERLPDALRGVASLPGVCEAMILSTCNRVEVLVRAEEPQDDLGSALT